MKEFYVYAWYREDYGTPFYIGKGKTTKRHNRAKQIKNNRHFRHIYEKVPTNVQIIQGNLSEKEAFELEKQLIFYLVEYASFSINAPSYKGKINKERHLVNCTYGGEGVSGHKHTQETIKKCTHYGKDNPMYGKCGKLSPHYGKVYDSQHREKIKLSNPKRKEVYCIELDRRFNSYREASKILLDEYNIICSHASISANCRNKIKYCGRYADSKKETFLHFKTITPTTTERTDVPRE